MSKYPSNLTQTPNASRTKEYFRWADYIELLCLASRDGEFSARDLEPYIRENLELVLDDEVVEVDELGTSTDARQSKKWEKWERRIHDFFLVINYRQQFMGSFYPFLLKEDHLLTLKNDFTDKNLFYLYLLFASNLSYVREYQHLITKAFEEISERIMRKLLPIGAEVHIFGTARDNPRYSGNLYDRICKLGSDIRATPTCSPANFAGTNAGDAGLDIVAWVPIPDKAFGIPVYFSQCACTVEKWREKQHSVGPGRWEKRYRWITPFNPIILVPFSFRSADGLWENDDYIEKTLMIDRDRIIKLLHDDISFFENTEACNVVKALVTEKLQF